ncbi:radical SAM family heme chaperone HemW [Paramagnetospirillum magneticum]|uniref:Heme chaperone HemW n=1 Tax=Paramagnetospirillum magneticum (strain ATCC 700264 / AMB-1) TaxID=342108 RepID=Q2VYM1_PARM1|nr:radical SAM family heme chaperone HemW [Paramagnetospirillum magneticum]BAE53304.1 Coproporphyrinogen III oxidase and related Fe-S oxidoreductase [Paramagnetospirillum magneticum AMB-1]
MSPPGFGIYIHWPFCLSKCPYCDFNSHASLAMDHGRWRAALLAELDHFAAQTSDRIPTSVFFGGGTPSLMEPETAGALVDAVKSRWAAAPDLEVTLEANPTSVEADRFRAFREAGINRLSLGIQALDSKALAFLGRRHSVDEALAALRLAQATFPRMSFDLIYSRPGQTEAQWRTELARALDLAGEHLSLYQLTIEDGTAFAPAHGRGEFALPDEDEATAQFETTQEMCEKAGLPAYEISNHARPGAECRHNLTYWQGGEWLGIGPGAHGRFDGFALAQARSPGTWLAQVDANGHATETRYALDPAERRSELVLMGLRLRNGLGPALLAEVRPALDPEALARMIEGGFLVEDTLGLRTTDRGRLVLNAVLGELLA